VEHYKKAIALNERLFLKILGKLTSVPQGRFSLKIGRLREDLSYLLH
jgi:hypothetical protein